MDLSLRNEQGQCLEDIVRLTSKNCILNSSFLIYREQGYGDILKLIPGTLEHKLKRMEDLVAGFVGSIPECPVVDIVLFFFLSHSQSGLLRAAFKGTPGVSV